MRKLFAISLLITFLSSATVAQDYIVKDSTYSSGTVRRLADGSIRYRKLKIDATTRYTADQIKEFGIGEKVFESVSYQNKSRFTERIVKEKRFTLFSVEGSYLLKKNDSLKEVKRADLSGVMQKYLNCTDSRILKKAFSTNKSITYNVKLLLKDCAPHSLRFSRTSLSFGFSQIEVLGDGGILTTERVQGEFSSPFVSVGKEIPFYKSKNLFLTTELMANLVSGKISSTTFSKPISAHHIILPVGLKWELPTGAIRPYLKGGLIASYSSYDLPTDSFSGLNFGLTTSVGIQIPFQTIHALQLEVRLIDTAKNSFGNYELGMSGKSAVLAYHF